MRIIIIIEPLKTRAWCGHGVCTVFHVALCVSRFIWSVPSSGAISGTRIAPKSEKIISIICYIQYNQIQYIIALYHNSMRHNNSIEGKHTQTQHRWNLTAKAAATTVSNNTTPESKKERGGVWLAPLYPHWSTQIQKGQCTPKRTVPSM